MFCITKWCAAITDSGKDEYTGRLKHMKERLNKEQGCVPELFTFRLLDDDGEIYAYGKSTKNDSFAPLDAYEGSYGCTEIQYRNPVTGKYETL